MTNHKGEGRIAPPSGNHDTEQIGPWRVTSKREAFSNPWIDVIHHEVVNPDGSPGKYGVVRFKNYAIGVLAIDSDGTILLVGQHRFPFDAYSWELPEGGGAKVEDPLVSAKRELVEETGYSAEQWRELIRFDVSNSVTDEQAICFIAWDLIQGAPQPEPTECFDYKRVSFDELHAMVLDGRITDSLTVVMALAAYSLCQKGELPDPVQKLLKQA
ncbi:MAG: NUDIX hydrolase [Pseudomonadota bacterium]